jgi:uncharacterized protein (TIGR04255 family)
MFKVGNCWTCATKCRKFLLFRATILCIFAQHGYICRLNEPMVLPLKIEPERLKDTLIEIRYQSEQIFEYRLGLFHKVLTEHGLTPSIPFNAHPLELNPTNFLIADSPINIFKNDILRLSVYNDRLVFNSNNTYQGWAVYGSQVKKLIELLLGNNLLGNIHWIGLRYVSEFVNIQIFDQLIWSFQYQWSDETAAVNTIFRTEWLDGNLRIIVNLVNNAVREEQRYSLMDVDVNLAMDIESLTLLQLNEHLDGFHAKEKEIFFGLMKPDFLTSLNPTY